MGNKRQQKVTFFTSNIFAVYNSVLCKAVFQSQKKKLYPCLETLINVLVCFFQDASTVAKNVMIYFDNSVDSFKNPIQPCTTVDECLDICDLHPEACAAPIDVTRIQTDGVWSREKQNNPFADYYKVIFLVHPSTFTHF